MVCIIFDLEMNAKCFKTSLPSEIIEIGAVKVNDQLEIVDTFQTFVRPSFLPLTSKARQITGITRRDVRDVWKFPEAIKAFQKWIGPDYTLYSWGPDDILQLKRDCELHHLETEWISQSVNLQNQFSQVFSLPKGRHIKLSSALEMLEIPPHGVSHRALNDAVDTANIFIKIFDRIGKPHSYNLLSKCAKSATSSN